MHKKHSSIQRRLFAGLMIISIPIFYSLAQAASPPSFTSLPITDATEDSLYSYGITATDLDIGDTLTISAPTKPAWLALTDNGDGTATLSGTPTNSSVGNHSVELQVEDSSSATDTQNFTINVSNTNDPPTFTSSPVTNATEDSPYTYSIAATDPDAGDSLTITAPTKPAWLALTDNGDGTATLTGTPLNEHVGNHTVTLQVEDLDFASDTQNFAISVANVNDPPTLTNFAKTGPEETDVPFTDTDFINSFTDVDIGDVLVTVKIIALPTNGTLKLSSTPVTQNQEIAAASLNNLVFTPNLNFAGTTSFDWNASDGQAYAEANATVGITISDQNDAPTISNIPNQTTNEDTVKGPVSFTIGDVETPVNTLGLGKDSSNTTLVPLANIVFGGSGANRTVTITPTLNLSGSATITISVSDGALTTSDSFVLTVNPVNDPPSFTKGSNQVVDEDAGPTSVPGWASGISPGPPNESSQTLTFTTTNNNNALFLVQPAVSATGTLSFTTAPNINGSATVMVTLKDNGGTANGGSDTSAAQSFTIIVTPANDAPLAQADTYSVMAGESLSKPAGEGVLANDLDVDGDTLTAQKVNNPDSGTVLLQADGSFTYTPEIGFTGVVTFTYQASDGIATSNIADVEIEVFDGSEPRVEFTGPVASGDTLDVYNEIVCLKAFAEDDISIDRVRFYWWNPVAEQYFDLSIDHDPPFEACIDTTAFPQGFNQVFAKSYDESGNESARKWIWLYKVADLWRSLLPVVGG